MSIFKKQSIIASYPACDIVLRENTSKGYTNITVNDLLCLKDDHLSKYQAGSIVSYALQYNECPIQAVDQCKSNMVKFPYDGHKLHWISQLPTCLSNTRECRKVYVALEVGQLIKFEGILFTVGKAPNNNLSLIPV